MPWWLLALLVAGGAAAAGSGSGGKRRITLAQLGQDAAAATGALVIDTCATAVSWKGKPPAWIGQALDAITLGASQIPIPGVAEGVALAVTVVRGILTRLKAGAKRSATVNPNSEDGEGIEAVLPATWTGTRNVEVTVYVQARRIDVDDQWYLLYASDQEETCTAYEDADQMSTVVAAWRASGRPITTSEIQPVRRVFTGPGRFLPARTFPNGVPDALPPKLAAYLQGAAFPIRERWSGPYASWVRPPLDTVRIGVVQSEAGDEFALRVWLPARVGALRWTIFWTIEGEAP